MTRAVYAFVGVLEFLFIAAVTYFFAREVFAFTALAGVLQWPQ